MAERILHCWKDRLELLEEQHGFGSAEWAEAFLSNGTCLLPADHEGPHEFTPDTEISISFVEDKP